MNETPTQAQSTSEAKIENAQSGPAAKPKSLVHKLSEVMAGVVRVPKRGHNAFHNYDYVMEADLCDAVRGELASRKVMIVPSVVSEERISLTEKQFLTKVKMRYLIVDGESQDKLEMDVIGYGSDAGDKGIYKAITGATKYMLMKLFLIATGDDPEGDEKVDKAVGKEAAKEVAQRKIKEATSVQQSVPALFYTIPDEFNGNSFYLMGDKEILAKWKEWLLTLKAKWSNRVLAFILPIEALDTIKYQAEKDAFPLKALEKK
jgi:hypothetical protein